MTAKRIRDKVRASRMKGMWMGGYVPLGYDVKDRKVVVNEDEAAAVRSFFERVVEVGSATVLARELRRKGLRNEQGALVDKGYLYRVLVNRVYRGDAVHKGKAYPGEHQAIIDEQLWDQVHAILRQNPRKRANNTRAQAPALLKGLIFTATGAPMTPSSTKKGVRRRIEAGEFNTVTDLAKAVGLAERHVSRQLRLAYLAPGVLKRLVHQGSRWCH